MTLTLFELGYLLAEPFLPCVYGETRMNLKQLIKSSDRRLDVLDVGGRKSHYTIGMPINVTISDLPRESELQEKLHLGINDAIKYQTLSRRSNVTNIILDDMTRSNLPSNTFDGVLAVEVLEHVEKDMDFLTQVYRVIKPNGFFLMTTPNGEHMRNTNLDHKRHYTKSELSDKISFVFGDQTEIHYIVADTVQHGHGLKSWSIRRPFQTLDSMFSNFINRIQSSNSEIQNSPDRTCHLLAIAIKS